LSARFDRIFCGRTGFATLHCLLARLHSYRAELPMVLEQPEIPLHQRIGRKVSAGTRAISP
jgi:hypothetical protein